MSEFSRQDAVAFTAPHSTRQRVVTLVCLLIFASVASGDAVADTCGHYLYKNGRPVSEHGISLLRSREIMNLGVFNDDPLKPCDGPRCGSQSTPLSTLPVALIVKVRGSDIAELIHELMWKSFGVCRTCRPESESGEIIEAGGIFRPPAA